MNRKGFSKTIILSLISILLLLLLSSCAQTAAASAACSNNCSGCPNKASAPTTQIAAVEASKTGLTNAAADLSNTANLTMVGYIIDAHCFAKKSVPGSDSRICLQMPACAATGYGIAVLQNDNTYRFFYFNGNTAPMATEAQIMAAKLIQDSTKNDNIFISVTGMLSGDTLAAPDGSIYPVFTVSSMSEITE